VNDAVEQARTIQRQAASPDRSVVLEAAAGSGKTKVLVDRFLRLCLGGQGVDPRAVLAITFTRRATVEIQARLQDQARRLARLDANKLRTELTGILGRPPTAAELERGAWFHEVMLEDPTGLGIDTLHAFCQKVLGRFAAEVGLDPHFVVLDDRQEAEYRVEATDRLESELAGDPEAAAEYAGLSRTAAGARQKVAGMFAQRVHLQRWLDRTAPPDGPVAAALARPLAEHHAALVADLQTNLLRDTPWADDPKPDLTRLAKPLALALRELAGRGLATVAAVDESQGFTTGFKKQRDDLKISALAGAAMLSDDPGTVGDVLDDLCKQLLTGNGKLRVFTGRGPTKVDRQVAFAAAARPVLELLALPPLLDLLAHNVALLRHGLRTLDLYAAAKRRDRVVDFQDLEYLALRLLTDLEIGPQVHYRLDARLDHLLLDECQDTNRNQWELLRPLIEEVMAGGDPPRTAFVVGDPKQSIYRFRGAEPGVFDAVRDLFRVRAGPDSVLRLPTNFRSLPDLVTTVGAVCQQEPLAGYLGDGASGALQEAARRVAPGQVTFVEPFDRIDEDSGHERAAAAMADLIDDLLTGATETWTWNPESGQDIPRPLRHDDILVLARTKTHLAAYEAALRRAQIPFLPAGRGLLARSREVQDLLALLRWLGYPADDTAGATVLRSPCFRLAEYTVQQLLVARRAGRRRSLREVLRQSTELVAASELLEGWFRLAGLLPLHDLLRRVAREGDLLARFETAGGEQARFNLLRLFDLALAADARGGSLRDFVAELEQADRLGGEEEGALPGEVGTGRVRVMTVHGAKGLEAPVVILADAAAPLRDATETLLLAAPPADGPWLLDVSRAHYAGPELPDGRQIVGPLTPAREQALCRAQAEEAHILYVALTRARDRLILLGGRGDRQRTDGYLGWLAEADADIEESVRATRWQDSESFVAGLQAEDNGDAAAPAAEPDGRAVTAVSRQRTWAPPSLTPRLVLAAPSQLDDDRESSPLRGGEAADDPDASPAPAGKRDNPATRRGTRIHDWLERACLVGEFPAPPASADHRPEWDEARAVWDDPALAWVFRPGTTITAGRGLSEVPILHRTTTGSVTQLVTGFIDRLVLRPGRVDILDYKSNRIEPAEVPVLTEHYRPQLAAYREALAVIYPDREIRCWLIWTWPDLAAVRLTEVTDP